MQKQYSDTAEIKHCTMKCKERYPVFQIHTSLHKIVDRYTTLNLRDYTVLYIKNFNIIGCVFEFTEKTLGSRCLLCLSAAGPLIVFNLFFLHDR